MPRRAGRDDPASPVQAVSDGPDISKIEGMVAVARFYAWGVFKGEEHPYHKTMWRKLNPLQAASDRPMIQGRLRRSARRAMGIPSVQ